jgi:uncharacterized membrane protein
MNWYLALKYLHVLLAITAVGANISYAVWFARSAAEPEHLAFALRGIKFLDDRVANPCYGGLLLTGLILVFVGNIGYTTTWVVVAIVLWLLLVIVAAALYTPNLKRRIEAAEGDGWESAAYQSATRQGTLVGVVLAVIALVIVFDMVVKPHF